MAAPHPTAAINREDHPEIWRNVDSKPTSSTLPTESRVRETCCICLSPIDSTTRAVATPCLHACFDFSCLVTWLESAQSTCPICKQVVESVKYDFDANGSKFRKYRVNAVAPGSSGGAERETSQHRIAESRRYRRLAVNSASTNKPADDIPRRRFVYKHSLRSLHIGINRKSRFANYTPQSFRRDKELVSKARAFIRRELEVFEWTKDSREWLVEYILAIVKTVSLKGADGKAEELIGEVLGKEWAGVFVHELHAWLKSPFLRVRDYDAWAQYAVEIPKDLKANMVDLGETAGNG